MAQRPDHSIRSVPAVGRWHSLLEDRQLACCLQEAAIQIAHLAMADAVCILGFDRTQTMLLASLGLSASQTRRRLQAPTTTFAGLCAKQRAVSSKTPTAAGPSIMALWKRMGMAGGTGIYFQVNLGQKAESLSVGLEVYHRTQAPMSPIHKLQLQNWRQQIRHIMEESLTRRLLGQENQKLEVLNRVSQAVASSLDLDRIFQTIYSQIIQVVKPQNMLLAMADPEQGKFNVNFAYQSGRKQRPFSFDLGPGMAKVIWKTKRSILTSDYLTECRRRGIIPAGRPAKAWLGVPLLAGDRCPGVLLMWDYSQSDSFTNETLSLVESLAQQAAMAIENARIYQESQRQLAEVTAINRIGQAISRVMELDKLWPLLHQQLKQILDASNFYVALSDSTAGVLHFQYQVNEGRVSPAITRKFGNGLTEHLITIKKPLLITDLKEDRDRHNLAKVKLVGKPAKSWLGVPIISKGMVLGVMAVQSYTRTRAYTQRHQELMTTVASQVATAIENSRLYLGAQQRVREVATLFEVGQEVVKGQSLDQLLKRLLEIIKQGLGYLNCAILLADEDGQHLTVRTAIGYPSDIIGNRLMIGKEGITGWAAAQGKTVYARDVRQDKHYIQGSSDCRSEVALPLKSLDRVLGVLDVQHKKVDGFDNKEISLLENFANQASLAIDRIRTSGIAQEKIRELSNLFDISQSLAVRAEFSTLIKELAGKLAAALGVGKCLIGVYLAATNEIELMVPDRLLKSPGKRPGEVEGQLRQRTFHFNLEHDGAASKVFHKGRPFITNRAQQDPQVIKSFVEYHEIQKLLVMPLQSRSKTIGVVYLADKQDGADFSEQDVRLAEVLVGQTALVVDNALLYRETSQGLKQLSTLYQMSQSITSAMTVDEIVQLGVQMVGEVIPADIISLMLLDPGTGELEITAARGLGPETVRSVRFQRGQGLAGWAAEHQEVVITANLQQDPRYQQVDQKEGIGAAIAIPLISKDRVLGVLNINNRQEHRETFTQEQLQLVSTLAGSISLALERGELISALDGRVSAQKALLETGTMLLGALEMKEVLKQISGEIERFIPFNALAIYRADWDKRLLSPIVARGPFEKEIMLDQPFSVDTGITGAIAITGKAEIINDTNKDPRAVHIEGTGEDSEAILSVPLLVQGKTEAVLTLWRDPFHPFTASELELASLFANQAAVAWNNAKLFEEIRTRETELADTNNRLNLALKRQIEVNTELSTLQYLSSTILSSLKLEEILSVVVEGIRTSLGFESVVMSLVDDSGQYLVHKAASGLTQQEFEAIQQVRPGLEEYLPLMRPEHRISNSYFLPQGHQANWTSLELPSGFKKSEDSAWHHGDKMLIPLYSKEKNLLAIIQIDKPASGLIPDKKKVRSLEAFGNTAVLAIENARLYTQAQSRITELSTLYDIGMVISSAIEIDRLLEKVVTVIREKLHYLKVAIFLVEPHSQSLLIAGQSGYGDEIKMMYFTVGGNSVVGWVAEQGEPLMLGDVTKDPRYSPADDRVQSEIVVPIKREGKTIGVLSIEDDKLNAFDESDLRLLTTLASQVSVALDNARLYEEAKRRINELSALHNVGTTVSSTLKLETLLGQVCQILEETFHYYKIAILLVDAQANELELVASHGYSSQQDRLGQRLKIGQEGITGMVAASGEPLVIEDVTKSPNYVCIDTRTRSELAVPLKIKNRVIGVLNVESDIMSAFDRVDLRLLETLANQVAVAVENARLYEETEQLAVTDGLTEVYNHRYFQGFLDRELSRAKRYHRPLSMIMMDIDHFKGFNDTYGHQAGDEILRRVAVLIKLQARDVDLVARYGGEEFMVVLPETGKYEAQSLAERIRVAVKSEPFALPGQTEPRGVTISLGVASYPEDGSEKSELVDKVDKALYRAKAGGRDQVSI